MVDDPIKMIIQICFNTSGHSGVCQGDIDGINFRSGRECEHAAPLLPGRAVEFIIALRSLRSVSYVGVARIS